MIQEMSQDDAFLHLLWGVAMASSIFERVEDTSKLEELGYIQADEYEFFEKVVECEGINISAKEMKGKHKELVNTIGADGVINEALKAANECSREWKAKVVAYMLRMACSSWEGNTIDGERMQISDKEWAIISRVQKYLGVTVEERNKALSLTLDN